MVVSTGQRLRGAAAQVPGVAQLRTVRLSKNTGLFTHAVKPGMLNNGRGGASRWPTTDAKSVLRQPVPIGVAVAPGAGPRGQRVDRRGSGWSQSSAHRRRATSFAAPRGNVLAGCCGSPTPERPPRQGTWRANSESAERSLAVVAWQLTGCRCTTTPGVVPPGMSSPCCLASASRCRRSVRVVNSWSRRASRTANSSGPGVGQPPGHRRRMRQRASAAVQPPRPRSEQQAVRTGAARGVVRVRNHTN